MSLRDFSFSRPINSYTKFQAIVSKIKRNSRSQLSSPHVAGKRYLNVGCGPNSDSRYINLEYNWHPGIDLCWDIAGGIPLASNSLDGIFSEHCLEHFSLETGILLVREFRRLLVPGGRLRLALPDAELYLSTYFKRLNGIESNRFPYEDEDRASTMLKSALVSVNRVFYVDRDSVAGHRCMYDYELISEILGINGFSRINKCPFRTGVDKTLLIDVPSRKVESFNVEAEASEHPDAEDGSMGLVSSQ